jgi:hypothetical protein
MSANGTATGSEIPTPMITPSKFSYFPMNMNIVNKKLESLSRSRNGQLPVLEHLLSEEGSQPLSLGMCLARSTRSQPFSDWCIILS